MNKSDTIEVLAARLGTTFSEAERFINTFFGLIYEKVKAGEKMNLSGFGQFSFTERRARLGVNPRTLQKITIPAQRVVKFKSGEAFKAAIK